MKEEKVYTREDVRDAAAEILYFLEINHINSNSDLRRFHGKELPGVNKGSLRIKSLLSGALSSNTKMSYRPNGDSLSVLKLRFGGGVYGGYLAFRCGEFIEGYDTMKKRVENSGNVLHEKVFDAQDIESIKISLETLVLRLG
jgi:hypothetical protein